MKRLMLPACVMALLPALVGAQSEAQRAVDEALGNLRSASSLWLRLDANETTGSNTRARAIHTFWARSFDPQGQMVAKAEMRDFDQGALATRLVGDGLTFWRHDVKANTYSAKRYGAYSGGVPPTYLQTLLQGLTSASEGHGTYLARLLKETYGSSGAHFSGWVPADLGPVLLTSGSRNDPVFPSRTYTATPEREFAMFYAQLPGAERSLVFELDTSSGRRLLAIYFAERDTVGRLGRLREWTSTVWPNILPAGVTFEFAIPAGATPIAFRGG